ncbi:hypothetical protein VTN00DRAFT_6390 [Thermoascus crustaceus]|uniref:uncharacterized protein n=1 Tax=Thermoascus crustaceus TaxID=5088 RepID=UPI0037430041
MWLLSAALEYGAPVFLVTSPLTSYSDQIYSIHKNKSSAGFSLDIPLIMLVASILKVFYWFGAYYSYALLAQAVIMVAVQLVLLKVALDNRPAPGIKDGIEHVPFSGHDESNGWFTRPYNFWQWRSTRPYWMFLVYFSLSLFIIHVFFPFISRSESYINLLGSVGLAVEAFLPVPQVLANQRARSCKGFRLSVVAAWILGDVMKMSYFFCSKEPIPWAFRMCATFQCICDCYLGVQYWMFGNGPSSNPKENGERWTVEEKDLRLA